MPIVRKISDSQYDIVFWKIEETVDEMLSILNADHGPNVSTPEKLTAHHLAGRAAMLSLIPDADKQLVKDEFGKPHAMDGSYHLSVSHSGDYAVAIGSGMHPVGIDIERIGNRIRKIASKFVNEEEEKLIRANDELKALYLIWSAKEAMYKLYGRKALNFKKHLFVEPFDIRKEGYIYGRILKGHIQWAVKMKYELSDGYSLVWTAEAHREIV